MTMSNHPQPKECKWCVSDGQPEWSYAAKVWIHRRATLDKACLKPPNNYGYTTQVPEDTISREAAQPQPEPARFPIGKCKSCGKDVGELADGHNIVFCSYACYCND